jgi:hypothetical protein
LSEIHKKKGNWKQAYEMHALFTRMNDSINNDLNRRAAIKSGFQYQYEKKLAADSVAFLKQKEITEVQMAKQRAEINAKRTQQYALYCGLAIVLIFSGFLYNRFKVTQSQKKLIEEQKHVVEEKQKEIIDSIRYARRIQRSLLPPEKLISKTLNKLLNK